VSVHCRLSFTHSFYTLTHPSPVLITEQTATEAHCTHSTITPRLAAPVINSSSIHHTSASSSRTSRTRHRPTARRSSSAPQVRNITDTDRSCHSSCVYVRACSCHASQLARHTSSTQLARPHHSLPTDPSPHDSPDPPEHDSHADAPLAQLPSCKLPHPCASFIHAHTRKYCPPQPYQRRSGAVSQAAESLALANLER
jgi:hypothetical protein